MFGACRQQKQINAAGALLGTAPSMGELLVADRIAVEALTATLFVRQRQGPPRGADLPDVNTAVQQPTPVHR